MSSTGSSSSSSSDDVVDSVNDLTGDLTIATGTSGSDFNVASSGTTVTLNLPTASASNRGALSSSDWYTFNSKQASGSYVTALTGDVTASGPGSAAATIAAGVVTNAKLSTVATATIKGRTTSGTGAPEDLTVTQATALLNAVVGDSGSGGTKGLVPAPSAGDAAAGKFLKADGTFAVPSDTGITALTGDVTASGTGSVAATVASVGGQTSTNVAAGAVLANAATASNTVSTIVKRDGSGNFSAGTITASLTGNVTGNASGSAASFTGNLVGDVSGTQGATVVDSVGGQTSTNVAAGAVLANAATSANTASAIAKRDSDGNIVAAIISPTTTKTANYTITAADHTIFCDTSGGAFSLTLPAPVNGKRFRIVDVGGVFNTNNLTVVRNGTEKINLIQASKVLQTNHGRYDFDTNGTDWFV